MKQASSGLKIFLVKNEPMLRFLEMNQEVAEEGSKERS